MLQGKMIAVAVAAILGLFMLQTTEGVSSGGEINVYYFPEQTVCTLIVDFEPRRDELSALDLDARNLEIARTMIGEFAANGDEQCKDAPVVRMMATYITGVDTYGRPNFATRVNLLRIEGQADSARSSGDLDQNFLTENFAVESY